MNDNFTISVASGKGGTGKTTIATSLALALDNVHLIDCDVEEPNAHLFIQPELEKTEKVSIPVPKIDEAKCTHCGTCAEVCAFNALAVLPESVLVFEHLCHGCGACSMLCPESAISEMPHELGIIEHGRKNGMRFSHGILNIGEPMAVPIIKQLKKESDSSRTVILDAPPGTSCPVVETVGDTDYCLLVTEPTPFGLNDLKLAVAMLKELQIPHGVILNRADLGDNSVERYCEEENVPLLMRIPFDRRIAEGYSRGEPLLQSVPEYEKLFKDLFMRITSNNSST